MLVGRIAFARCSWIRDSGGVFGRDQSRIFHVRRGSNSNLTETGCVKVFSRDVSSAERLRSERNEILGTCTSGS
jgi:hypothetical protein